jgi:nucleoside-diphosphate-sugar epimerase
MNILITGNMGYVGSVLVGHLRSKFPNATLIGFDSGFFAHCLTNSVYAPEANLNKQYFGDVRDFPSDLLENVDCVVHLAAVSNDPMGNKFESVTEEINFLSTIKIVEMARDKGVNNFVFASSCSMYGAAEGGPRKEDDPLNPLTAYARSKAKVEETLSRMELKDMVVSALRFATACGMSNRLRLDLVLNDFVACALANSEISVLSDGTPWRPLIDVNDMARAIEWGIVRTMDNGGQLVRVNVGSSKWNYQVKDLATAVAELIADTNVAINENAPPDKRSYQVDFTLFQSLAPAYQPQVTLTQAIAQLKAGLLGMNFKDTDFRSSQLMRLKVLERFMDLHLLSSELRWRS